MKNFIRLTLFAIVLASSPKCGNDKVHQHLKQQDIERTERWRKHLRENGVFSAPVEPTKGKEAKNV